MTNRALFQDDLHIPQDYDLEDRAPRTISRQEIQDMMFDFVAKGGKVQNVTLPKSVPTQHIKFNPWCRGGK